MKEEENVIAHAVLVKDKLVPYGFKEKDGGFVYEKEVSPGFLAIVSINDEGVLTGKVMDVSLGEEYRNFRYESGRGGFASLIREEYLSLLEDIKRHCYHQDRFVYPLTNALAERIEAAFEEPAEFLFGDYPDFAVYRNKITKKWYAVIMRIPRRTLGLEEEGEIEIMNLKVDPNSLDELLIKEGFFRAYHMNKKHWLSVSLDGMVAEKDVWPLIEDSRRLAK